MEEETIYTITCNGQEMKVPYSGYVIFTIRNETTKATMSSSTNLMIRGIKEEFIKNTSSARSKSVLSRL